VDVTAASLRPGMNVKGHGWAVARDGERWAYDEATMQEELIHGRATVQ